MAHNVTCAYCHQKFDRDKFPFVQLSPRKYAHKECSLTQQEQQTKEEKDKEALNKYIMDLFKTTYVDPRIQKQIKQYVDEYNFTYSGIHKALIYFFEVKGNSVEKANGGIGIVPYVYKHAYNYYFSLWQAQQINKDKTISLFIPSVKEVTIKRPERKVKKRVLFGFLDEEEENA